MNSKINRYMNIAREVAGLSSFNRVRIGCCIVYRNGIISTGYNKFKTHPSQKIYDNKYRMRNNILPGMLHAEMDAIIPIRYNDIDFKKCVAYIYRMRRDIPCGFSRPCPSCYNALKDLGIRDIYYSADYDNIVYHEDIKTGVIKTIEIN